MLHTELVIEKIKWLINESGLTYYRIHTETGVAKNTLDRLMKGESDVNNLPLATAQKLEVFVDKIRKEELEEMESNKRDEMFARALAVLDKLSARLFEKGRQRVEVKYFARFDTKPMTVLSKAYTEVMEYADRFDDTDRMLIDRVNGYIAELDDTTYTDERLTPKFLVYNSNEHQVVDRVLNE